MKKFIKQVLGLLLSNDMVIWLYLHLREKKPRIILYHGVSDQPEEMISSQVIAQDVFEAQIAYLKMHYKPVLLSQMTETKIIGNAVTITFDDGYENNYRVAVPLLQKYGQTAAIFVNPKHIDQTEKGEYKPAWWDIFDYLLDANNVKEFIEMFSKNGVNLLLGQGLERLKIQMEETLTELPPEVNEKITTDLQSKFSARMIQKEYPKIMTWAQLRELSQKGIEIGAHTMSHLSVASLSLKSYEYELVEPKKIIESHLGNKVYAFAFPFGGNKHFSSAALNTIKNAGYRCALLVAGKGDNSFCFSRVSIHKKDDFRVFKIKVAGIYDDFAGIYRKAKNIWKKN